MTPENFVYWLQGFMEISNTPNLNERETQIIKDHLNLVFNKVTPTYDSITENIKIEEKVKEQECTEKVSKRKKISFQDILDSCNPTEIKVLPRLRPNFTPRRNNRDDNENKLLC